MLPRFLGIAPYENMKILMQQIAKDRTDFELTVFLGDLEEGAAIASKYTIKDFDIIISRGGTAELIQKVTDIPVFDVTPSVYDLLRAVLMVNNTANRYAVIAFPNIAKNVALICSLMHYNIDTFTIHNLNEAKNMLNKIKNSGYELILCDSITYSLASNYPLNLILITSGVESLTDVIDKAVQYVTMYQKSLQKANLLQAVIDHNINDIYIFNTTKVLIYHTSQKEPSNDFVNKLVSQIPYIKKRSKLNKISIGSYSNIYTIQVDLKEETYYVFYVVHSKKTLYPIKNGILNLGKEEIKDDYFLSFYRILLNNPPFIDIVNHYNSNPLPIILNCHKGSGESRIIKALYMQGSLKDSTLTIINCANLVDEKNWYYFMQNINSPINDSNTTIYFNNIEDLPDSQFHDFLDAISDSNLHHRNKLIFSFTKKDLKNEKDYCKQLYYRLSCIMINLPTLKQCTDSISNLITLCINSLNLRYGTSVIGFESDAIEYLKAFNWPYNYEQFFQMLNTLVSSSNASYIQVDKVKDYLEKENAIDSENFEKILPLKGTLDTITYNVVKQVLLEEKGNHTSAAKRLGIGRSTLWRLLQRHE